MWGNEGCKWSSAGTLILASLLPEEVMQNWLLSMGRSQGGLLRGKLTLGKGNQGSAAYPAHACLGELSVLLSLSSSFPVSSLGERKSVYLDLESSYCRIAVWLFFKGSHAPGIGRRERDISKDAGG